MAALFALPHRFTPAATTPTPLAGSVAYLANDVAGQVWRGAVSSYFVIDLGSRPVTYDTIALVATNLRPTDSVRVQTGTTDSGTGSLDLITPAYDGDYAAGAMVVVRLPANRSERFVRIDITAPGHPDAYVQVTRLVVAKAITTLGISPSSKQTFDDDSVRGRGPGYTTVDEYPTYVTWQVSCAMITDDDWLTKWNPFLRRAGNKRGILFIPETEMQSRWQSMAIFGLIEGSASGSGESFNSWRFEATIRSLFSEASGN